MAALFDKISNMSGAVNLIATFALVFGCFIIDIINVIRYIRLKTKLKKMGITIPEINQVSYQYISLDINKTVRELGIPNGGVISIKLKSSF